MRIGFVQLSDIHCVRSASVCEKKIQKIAEYVKSYGPFENIALIVSGDLTNTGSLNEFKTAKMFFGSVQSHLGSIPAKGFIPMLVVPGNHDMRLPDGCRGADEIIGWNADDHLAEEADRLKGFFSYANSKRCFLSDKICDTKNIDYSGIKIQFCLLNSALFSTREKEDKQIHHLPSWVEEKAINRKGCELNITVIHHHFEWFDWDSKVMLKRIITNSDVAFFGHDHKTEHSTTQYSDGSKMNIVMGGVFGVSCEEPAEFNLVIYDSETKEIKCSQAVWDIGNQVFVPRNSTVFSKNTGVLTPSEEYVKKLVKDSNGICDVFTDYYTVPKFYGEGATDFDERGSFQINSHSMFEALKETQVIRVIGQKEYGKTTLMKYLYSESISEGLLPLYIEKRDYRDSNIEKMMRSLFEEQYAAQSDALYAEFRQIENSKKVIFLDDADLISSGKAAEKLIKTIIESGMLLVYTTTDGSAELVQITQDRLEGKQLSTLYIQPMYKESRDLLIEKISGKYGISASDTELIKETFDYMVSAQASFFSLTPGSIIQYLKLLAREDNKAKVGDQTISIVFETNIRNAMFACEPDVTGTLYLTFLESLANSMYFEKRVEHVPMQQLNDLVQEYNAVFRTSIATKKLVETCEKARIFTLSDNYEVSFFDNNTYAYFVAKALNREFERNHNNRTKLEYVMEHICFGINDTIILFLSFIRSNTEIILRIAKSALSQMEIYQEWDIDSSNLPFLQMSNEFPKSIPTADEKMETRKQIEKREKEMLQVQEAVKFRGIFDYDEDTVNQEKYKALRALKYSHIIGRALVDQYGAITAEDLDVLINAIYETPQKVVYALLKPYQEHYEEIVEGLGKVLREKSKTRKYTEEDIRRALSISGTSFALDILNGTAYHAAKQSTIHILRESAGEKTTHKVFRLMMEENIGDTEFFSSEAIRLRKELSNNNYACLLISQIVRKHLLFKTNVDYKIIDKLISGKLLSEKSRQTMLLTKKDRQDQN